MSDARANRLAGSIIDAGDSELARTVIARHFADMTIRFRDVEAMRNVAKSFAEAISDAKTPEEAHCIFLEVQKIILEKEIEGCKG